MAETAFSKDACAVPSATNIEIFLYTVNTVQRVKLEISMTDHAQLTIWQDRKLDRASQRDDCYQVRT